MTEPRQIHSRGIAAGMAIAAGIVAPWDETRAEEILYSAGLMTLSDLRAAGVDRYDIVQLRSVIRNIASRARNLRDAGNSQGA